MNEIFFFFEERMGVGETWEGTEKGENFFILFYSFV